MNKNYSSYPCPICKQKMLIIGKTMKGEKLTSCGHAFKFKKTRSEKDIDRKFIQTPWGLERVPAPTLMDELEKCSEFMQDIVIAIVKKEGF